jgi:hypothetical protein
MKRCMPTQDWSAWSCSPKHVTFVSLRRISEAVSNRPMAASVHGSASEAQAGVTFV